MTTPRPHPAYDYGVVRVTQMPERLAQAVAERVVALVVDALDVNAIVARVDLDALLARVDLDAVLARIDVEELVALATWWLVYFAGSWAIAGRTLGMGLFGLRVVRADGRAVSTTAAVARALAFPLSVALFGLGFLGILVHPRRRALHDLIAGTAVIY